MQERPHSVETCHGASLNMVRLYNMARLQSKAGNPVGVSGFFGGIKLLK